MHTEVLAVSSVAAPNFVASEPLVDQHPSWSSLRRFQSRVATSPRWLVALGIFVLGLAPRLIDLHQPLFENYIDRQVHTAMMARNLARGGSPLYPEIDIGPFPAYYMLECPIFPALAAGVSAITGLELDVSGRLVSAVAMAFACLLFYDLVRRHDRGVVAFLAAAALALMPVTIRYGREFQPDAMMFALLIAGVWAMDRWSEHGMRRWLFAAAVATSAALLLKVIVAYVLLPLAYLAWKRHGWSAARRWDLWAALVIAVAPSAAWYIHAWQVASGTVTVSTPFWEAHQWISLERFFDVATYRQLAYFIGWRVLTPIGVVLAILGTAVRAKLTGTEPTNTQRSALSTRHSVLSTRYSMIFHIWLASLITYFPILVRKLDHEHYYLALAPVAAVFIARALVAIATAPLATQCYVSGRTAAVGLGVCLLALNALACRSTFQTPKEWRSVTAAAAAARELVPADARVAAHSSVLFYADRRGFTFAYGPDEIEYLFGTWAERGRENTPASLLEFYREQGADYFVELLGTGRELKNTEFFEYVRSQFVVLRDAPAEFIVVALRERDQPFRTSTTAHASPTIRE
jgi:hypothetical protein